MRFGWINLFAAVIVVFMIIPNIIYAVRNRGQRTPFINRAFLAAEQVGRYACIILMWLPLLVWKFGFGSIGELLLYLGGNVLLMLAYYVFWLVFRKRKNRGTALALAIIPTCIFLLSGVLLRHWLLVIAAVLFGVCHISITYKSFHKEWG